jgi:hypothetical protein
VVVFLVIIIIIIIIIILILIIIKIYEPPSLASPDLTCHQLSLQIPGGGGVKFGEFSKEHKPRPASLAKERGFWRGV